MKHFFTLLALLAPLHIAIAQMSVMSGPPPVPTETTTCGTKETPVYQSPIKLLDWRKDGYIPFYLIDNSVNANAIPNPYLDTRNNILVPLALPPDGILDYEPDEGWRLIKKDWGYHDDGSIENIGSETPFMILYNQYRGIMRIFVCLGTNHIQSNGIVMNLTYTRASASIPSILDQSFPLKTLDDFAFDKVQDIYPYFKNVSQFIDGPLKWFYADIPITYDPCVCLYESLLSVKIAYTLHSDVRLQGVLNGNAVSNGIGENDDRDFALGDTRAGRVIEAYNNADAFKQKESALAVMVTGNNNNTTVSGINAFGEAIKENTFLQAGLSAIPYVAAGMELIDAFIGGGRTAPQQVEMMPLVIHLDASFDGGIDTQFPVPEVNIYTPGSKPPAHINQDSKPFYDKPLGIFNVLDKVEINHDPLVRSVTRYNQYHERYEIITEGYKIANPIRYVVNPSAGLNVQEVKAQIFSRSNNEENIVTELFDVDCIHNREIGFTYDDLYGNGPGATRNFFIKFFVNLQRGDATPETQNVLLVQTYPVTIHEVSSLPGNVACSGGRANTSIDDAYRYCKSGAYVNTARGTTRQGIEEGTNRQAQYLDSLSKARLAKAQGSVRVRAYPNPATTSVTLQTTGLDMLTASIEVFDALGKAVAIPAPNQRTEHTATVPLSCLAKGLYQVRITDGAKRAAAQVSVQ